jgi:hypothetical protein
MASQQKGKENRRAKLFHHFPSSFSELALLCTLENTAIC